MRKGKWLGLADGEPVAGGETFDEVARAVLERLLARAARGAHAPHRRGARRRSTALLAELAAAHPELELEVHEGGQPHYPLCSGGARPK